MSKTHVFVSIPHLAAVVRCSVSAARAVVVDLAYIARVAGQELPEKNLANFIKNDAKLVSVWVNILCAVVPLDGDLNCVPAGFCAWSSDPFRPQLCQVLRAASVFTHSSHIFGLYMHTQTDRASDSFKES